MNKPREVNFNNMNVVKRAMAKELDDKDIEIEEDKGLRSWGVDTFYRVTSGSKEYVVARDEEAVEELALAKVRQDLEQEPELFNQSWLEDHIDIDALRDELMSDVTDMAYEDLKDQSEEADDSDLQELAEQEATARLKDPIEYLEDIYGKADAVKEAIRIAGIDIEDAAQAAVSEDGAAHFLSSYDGNTYDLPGGMVYWREN